MEGGGHVVAVLREEVTQAVELPLAPLDGLGAARTEGGAQARHDVGGLLGGPLGGHGVVHGASLRLDAYSTFSMFSITRPTPHPAKYIPYT